MFSIPSISDPLVVGYPEAVELGVPSSLHFGKARAEGRSGCEVLGPSSNWGSLITKGSGENLCGSLV